MQPFEKMTGLVAPMDRANVDTDQIIPKQFLHPWHFLHACYVLRGGELALVDVLGQTHRERFDGYKRFVPPLRYLRYDRSPPAFLSYD